MSLSLLCSTAPVALDTRTTTENETILDAAGLLARSSDVLDPAGFAAAVLERQRISPPLLGNGIALPHARTSLVREIIMSITRTLEPVPFGPHGSPVRLIFLYGIPPHRVAEHLATTAALARKLRDPEIVHALLEAADPDTFRKLLA